MSIPFFRLCIDVTPAGDPFQYGYEFHNGNGPECIVALPTDPSWDMDAVVHWAYRLAYEEMGEQLQLF